PRPLGRHAREPPLRRRRRGARLPGRVRLARRQRPAPAAPARARLRCRPAVPARLRDDLQPRRARRRPARCPRDGDRRRGAAAPPPAGAPAVVWNPPLPDEELGLRGSALAEAAKLQAGLVERGLRTLTFAKSRKAAELIHRFTAERLGDDSRLSPYRAGYTPAQRREIERRLGEGDLLGGSSTDALELGIDGGLVGAVISVGSPGTVASLRQQWGRAGRRGHGLAILVASEDALDQYFMREPRKLLGRRVEAAILDHANPHVLAGHVRSAAFEAPLDEADAEILGPEALVAARGDPELRATPRGIVWAGRQSPSARVALRSAGPDAFAVVDGSPGDVLGLVERSRAYSTIHDGAVSLHLGASYLVQELDERAMRAIVEPFRGDWYTQA